MPRGRPRKPIEQKEREGNPGNRKLPAPIVVDAQAPIKPSHLGAAGAQLWDEVVVALAAAGIVQRVDTAALTALCAQWDLAEKARQVLAVEGHYALGSTGQVVEHPAIAILTRSHGMFLKFATEFGITSAARARIAESAGNAMASLAQAQADEILDLDAAEVIELD